MRELRTAVSPRSNAAEAGPSGTGGTQEVQARVDSRSVAYTYAFIGIKRLGAAQFYRMTIKDKSDAAFDGTKTYHLHVPSNPPAKQYCSATVYDREKHTVLNTSRASCASNSGVQKNSDGSVDICFAPQSPPGEESNWVPTITGKKVEVLFRLYGPDKPLFDRTWVLPDIELLK